MLVRNTFFLAVLGVIGCTDACAQAVWQADVQIQTLTVTAARGSIRPVRPAPLPRVAPPDPVASLPTAIPSDALDINVTVFSNNDDDA
jgi:hypothetical protein